MIQRMLAIWSLVRLPFLNPVWTSGSPWFTYYWSLAWRILSITLLGSLNSLWHCLSLGLEWKLTFSSLVANAEFSKFAGILSVALSQHHLLGFEVAHLEFHHLHSVQFSSVQSLSRVWLLATLWIAVLQASLSITISRSSLRLTSIESVMSSSHLILCRPLFLLPPIPPSIRVFSNESSHLH